MNAAEIATLRALPGDPFGNVLIIFLRHIILSFKPIGLFSDTKMDGATDQPNNRSNAYDLP
jgi:hypothetical protein